MKIAIVGLGYVGLPLAVEFGKKYPTVGFDINQHRIEELVSGYDRTLEVESEKLKASEFLSYTTDLEEIRDCTIYIVTVPTPIDKYKNPDLKPVFSASRTVGKVLGKGDIVIYESTVYPGCTEEDCVPLLEEGSGLTFNEDFFCGYSPERINPGDKEHTVTKILKVTSGSTPEIADRVDELYRSIIEAGTFKASSIKVAEAAKVIENSQRDINIAYINELALIFDRMGIDTHDVLEAAGTKWNFMKFKPGLVGGHCIGVDPYYLTHKAESLGYYPEVILAGRRINDNMGLIVGKKIIKLMIKKGIRIEHSSVLILGMTFKENCPDIRNSRVIDVIDELKDYGCRIDIYDPWADAKEVAHEYGLSLLSDQPELDQYDAIVLAVGHKQFLTLPYPSPEDTIIYDIKGLLDKSKISGRL
ncbi:Vi polysaccharide biosynthesis UDP-N-acetylglucosamine C-6 dehydrogenase TviB [Sulfuricurvum sp.]|uniref:Vi polysaccharide biosynthesis UDP-N-acetylglucosamine C-6 dehydrogenase TviB n=1 Tax=Sulfuricurvum sp. TaxID=2025608 RepID=UPI0025CEE033|nr:Vi polysaccharide biosynthesis UDP-N-acetylglucosamine C-6 dehydrogenase TviB [Sulfuricurvum sp.]